MDTTFEVGREYMYEGNYLYKYKCLCIDTTNNAAVMKNIRMNDNASCGYTGIPLSLRKDYRLVPTKQVATPKYVAVIESDGNPVISPLVWSNKKDLNHHAKMVGYKVIDIIEIKWEREV